MMLPSVSQGNATDEVILECVFLERLSAIFQPRLPVECAEHIYIPVSAPNLM
jgi:hypothetical protein